MRRSRTAFVERLSGSTWQSLPVPAANPALNVTLNAVSAASPTDVWCVGTLGGRLKKRPVRALPRTAPGYP